MKREFIFIIIVLFLLYYVTKLEIQKLDEKIDRQTKIITQKSNWIDSRLNILVDSFKVDKPVAIKILSEVWDASGLFNLDPDIILQLIEQESSFIPTALSSAGALGLMQVMPLWWRRYNPSADPFDVEENILMGCFVLWTYKNMSISLEEALARYYAGKNWEYHLQFAEEVLSRGDKWKQ